MKTYAQYVSPLFPCLQLCAIIDSIKSKRPSCPSVLVVRQRDMNELVVGSLMIEDKQQHLVSYVDFLCQVHSQIQSKLV